MSYKASKKAKKDLFSFLSGKGQIWEGVRGRKRHKYRKIYFLRLQVVKNILNKFEIEKY